jgi:unsaturated chondroitin disaccharide hydrolase
MDETAVSLWTDAIRRMLARIDDTARRVTEGFPNFADPQSGEWTTSPQGDWTGGTGSASCGSPAG